MSATASGLTLLEAYQAMTGLETIQYGTKIMVNNSGTWVEASESVLYNVIKNGGAKAVGSVQRIVPSAAKYTGIGVDYSTILGTNVQTALGSLPTTQEILFKVPTQMGGNSLATPTQLSNAMRAALQNSGAEISNTALQPITKMEIVQSSGQTAIKTTAKGILTKVPWNAVMVGTAAAQGVMLGIDIVETNPQLVTKIYNKLAGTDIDPEYIADIVENTTVWANVRDGAVFIAEDVVQAIKDVFWEEGVFGGNSDVTIDTQPITPTAIENYGLSVGYINTTGAWNRNSNDWGKWAMATEGKYGLRPLVENQQFVWLRVKNNNPGYGYTASVGMYNYYLGSNNNFKINSTGSYKGVVNNRNSTPSYNTFDEAPQPTIAEAQALLQPPADWDITNLQSNRYYAESDASVPGYYFGYTYGISGGVSSGSTKFTEECLLPFNFPVIDIPARQPSGNYTKVELLNLVKDYFENGGGIPVVPSQNVPGTSIIPGSTLPSTPGPVSNDYPAWYDSGVDTLADIDDQGNISNTRWVPVNIFDPQTQPEAQDGTTPDDDKRKAIVNTVDDSIEDNLQNDPHTEPKPQTYPEPNPEPGTDLQRVNPNPPSIDNSDGESPDPTSPILTTAITSGLAYIYNPTLTETKALGRVLWTANFVENLKKIFVNPMDGIIGFHILYATPKTKAPEEIVLGYYGTGVNSKVVTNQYVTIDCGRIGIDEVFNDARDYDPYTTAALYLPFIGIVDLKANDVVNSYVNIKYNVDVLTGTCIAFVEVAKKGAEGTLYQFVGNCAVQLPITSGNYTAVITSLLSVASSAVGGAMIGGVPGALFGGFKGAAINATRAKMSVVQSGNLGANAGAMGIRKPFIIIRRPVTKDAYAYNKQYGYPAFKWTMLGNMHGFTRVKAVHIDFVECTDEEEQMIIEALKEGVQL